MFKAKRTLGPAAFEAYMDFADSLKTPENSDAIDRFKYKFAVMEGYIKPKKSKAITESLGLGDFEKAAQGLISAFLPHLDEDEQKILGGFCNWMDEKIAEKTGKDQDNDAEEDEFDTGDDDEDNSEEVCPDCGTAGCDGSCKECDSDAECPEGETCKDGKCVKEDEPNSAEADTECCCGGKKKAKVECSSLEEALAAVDGLDTDLEEDEFPVDDFIADNSFDTPKVSEEYGTEPDPEPAVANEDEVDYDALADQLLSDNGYRKMTTKFGGVQPENQKFRA